MTRRTCIQRWVGRVIATAFIIVAGAGCTREPAPVRYDAEESETQPPVISLVYEGEVVQTASAFTYCWDYSGSRRGVTACADGVPVFPAAARVTAPAELRLRIPYLEEPERWTLHAYPAIKSHGDFHSTRGRRENVPFEMEPYNLDGRREGWDLVFDLEDPQRHYYLSTWGDLEQGQPFYVFHVRS